MADLSDELRNIAKSVKARFSQRILSIFEYLDVFAGDPVGQSRDASRYLRDTFDHYGTTKIGYPWGDFTRWNLFDLPWLDKSARRPLIGQEQVQEEIYRSLSNFAREKHPNQLILL